VGVCTVTNYHLPFSVVERCASETRGDRNESKLNHSELDFMFRPLDIFAFENVPWIYY